MTLISTIESNPKLRLKMVILAITGTLLFIGMDSWTRYTRILSCTKASMGAATPPKIDPESPTGYELGMRNLILPPVGTDGLHWVMHTQKLLQQGGWRIRFTDNDNVPDGREIHWSHGFIWWLIALGTIHSTLTGLPLAASVEAVSPYANTLIFVAMIAGLPWILYRRFGAIAASGFAISLGTIYTFYEFFMIGNADHHGFAAAGALMCGLLLAIGGAGWVAAAPDEEAKQPKTKSKSTIKVFEYVIEPDAARRYFIGSGIAGSVSLWVSAATAVPTFFGIGLGVLFSVLIFGRKQSPEEPEYDPSLWRWWGMTGCCGSLFFYLLEYFPSHMGMRLEVNHPLYALAWLGGGEILSRLTRWRVEGTRPWQGIGAFFSLIAAIVAVLLLPTLVKLYPEKYFWVTDEFLWKFHHDYIHEFKTIFAWAQSRATVQAVLNVCLFPVMGIVMFRLLFVSELGRSWKGLLTLLMFPAILVTCMGIYQIRWLGISNALWLPTIPAFLACVFRSGFQHRFEHWEKIVAGVVFVLVFVMFPMSSFSSAYYRVTRPNDLGLEDAFGVYIRDISHALRRASPERELVVVSGPTTTTHMMYFGGMKGIGTLYWENVPGLKATASIYAARTEPESRELVKRHRVSHIGIYASDAFAYEYTRLLRGLPFGAKPDDAFIPSMITNLSSPRWLKPLHIQPPVEFEGEWVVMLDVRLDQTEADAHFGVGEYLQNKGDLQGGLNEYQRALELDPHHRDAAYRLGSILMQAGAGEQAQPIFEKALVNRSPEEVTELCGQLALNCFNAKRHAEAAFLLRRALQATPGQAAATNALAWLLATSYDDKIRNPTEALTLAEGNTATPSKVTYFQTLAAAQAANEKFPEAIVAVKQAIEILQANVPPSNTAELDIIRDNLRHYESGKPLRIGG
jgi:hypothetical protein